MKLAPRVLLVEGDLGNLQRLWLALGRAGLVMDAATTNADARRLLRLSRYGVVVASVEARDREALELCGWARTELGARAPVFILVSSEAMPEDAERARLAGCDHYLTKPFSLPQIVSLALESVGGD